MHIMKMVVEIIYIIAATSTVVLEGADNFLIRLRLGYHKQRCMICIMFQILQNLILWHVQNQILMQITLVQEITYTGYKCNVIGFNYDLK